MPGEEMGAYQVGTELRVEPYQVIPQKDQPREWFDPKRMESFSKGLKRVGQRQPATVIYRGGTGKDARFELIDGERRLRACIINGEMLRILIQEVRSPAEQFLYSAVSNFGGEGNTPLEIAKSLARIKKDFGMTDEELGEIFGKSHAWATQYLGLLRLDPQVRQMMSPERPAKSRLKFWFAVSLCPFPPKEQLRLAKEICKGELKGTQARVYIRKAMTTLGVSRGGKSKKARTPNRDFDMLSNYLDRSVRDAHGMLSLSPDRFNEMFASRTPTERQELIGGAKRCIRAFEQIIRYMEGKGAMRLISDR